MKQTKVLLVDDNRIWLNTLKDELGKYPELDVVAAVDNGISALEIIKGFSVDVVLSGVIMRGYDGFALLESIKHLGAKQPKIMLMSLLCNDDMIKRAAAAGVTYFFRKPLSSETVYNRIKFFTSDINQSFVSAPENAADNIEIAVSKIIKSLGIPANVNGYKFVRDCIIYSAEHYDAINLVTKKLYPVIAEKYGTTAQCVERSIRSAIESAWQKADKKMIHDIFGNSAGENKPTNSEFIAMIADKVRLDMKYPNYVN